MDNFEIVYRLHVHFDDEYFRNPINIVILMKQQVLTAAHDGVNAQEKIPA